MNTSDVYALPMITNNNSLIGSDYSNKIVFDNSDVNCKEQVKVTMIALNFHDELVCQLQNSTDRLNAVYANTGSLGAKNQAATNEAVMSELKQMAKG